MGLRGICPKARCGRRSTARVRLFISRSRWLEKNTPSHTRHRRYTVKRTAITILATLMLSAPASAHAGVDVHLWLGAPVNGYPLRARPGMPRGFWRHHVTPRQHLHLPAPRRYHRHAPPPRIAWRHGHRRHAHAGNRYVKPRIRHYRQRIPAGRGYGW
ncbi:MAG: hypothetical protein DWQ08_09065 [Proteobacteria bacterium]|nr:MAG: hypothetical protein DWQ08_09065 [Pseudomonadota bacterium]